MNNTKATHYIHHHELALKKLLTQQMIPAPRVKEAMNYVVFSGGKRLRPLLVYLCGELLDVPVNCLDIIAAAIELTHCYSLVHDDLPAMDNDDFRRGKPSCHRAFDEATAILTGDGMQALAMEILLTYLPNTLPLAQVLAISRELVKASGFAGMVSGQSLDLCQLSQPHVTESDLKTIHELKTGKLFSACITMVLAACPSVGKPIEDALKNYAAYLGLVFQMQDDYLDRYGWSGLSGKKRDSDQANNKTTFATLFTEEQLQQLISYYFDKAATSLSLFNEKADDLRELTSHIQQRGNVPMASQ